MTTPKDILPYRVSTRNEPLGAPTIATAGLLWATAVTWASLSGALAAIPLPWLPALVVAGIAGPLIGYGASPRLRRSVRQLGLRRLTALHGWRIGAALLFFAYGAGGRLPAPFVALAGWGDLAAGLLALAAAAWVPAHRTWLYGLVHAFGMLDFVVAVGTGLTFSLLDHPQMGGIATFPVALIPFFGVGLSGASHVFAFDLLRSHHRRSGSDQPGSRA